MILSFAAIVQLGFAQLHADISWLLIVCEKILEGKSLYVDIIEVNPPFSIALYIPFVWLEKYTLISAERSIAALVFLLFGLCCWLGALVLRSQPNDNRPPVIWLLLALIALFFLPTSIFAQREHIGMMFFIPFLALGLVRLEDRRGADTPLWLVAICGLAGAVIVCVKPYYVLAILLLTLVQVLNQRSLKPVFHLENLVAAGAVLAYGLFVWLAFPSYISFVRDTLLDVYVAKPDDVIAAFFAMIGLVGIGVIAILMLSVRRKTDPVILGGLAMVVGFSIACVWQGKAWDYHLFPALLVTGTTLTFAYFKCYEAGFATGVKQAVTALALVPFLLFVHKSFTEGTPYTHELAALDAIPKGKTSVFMTQHFKLIHPAARFMGADWGNLYSNDWIVGFGLSRLEQDNLPQNERKSIQAHLVAAVDNKRAELARRPEMVITVTSDKQVSDLFMGDPIIAEIMREYEPLTNIGGMAFFVRKGAENNPNSPS